MKAVAIGFAIWITGQILFGSAWAGEDAAPEAVDFGPVRTGNVVADTIWVRNLGPADFLIESHTIFGAAYDLPATAFSGAPILLRPEEALPVPIRFSPPDTGLFLGRLEVATSAGVLAVSMAGEGVSEVVVINEILADPPSGMAGDANGDGIRDSNHDEFVELLNIGLRPIKLSGWQLCDRGAKEGRRFTFPAGTWIGPGERVVLFGGGNPTGAEAQVFADDGRIGGGLSNSGDAVYLIDPTALDTLARAAYGSEGGKDQSLVRHPEGRGAFVQHGLFPANGAAFSPGTPRDVLTQVIIMPSDTSIVLGESLLLSAEGVFSDETVVLLEEEVVWASSEPSVLRLDGNVAQAGGLGVAYVTACAGGVTSLAARVAVAAPGFQRLAITPAETLIVVGDAVAYAVEGIFPDGARERLEDGLAWTSSDSSVACPVGDNHVTAQAPGIASICIFMKDLSASASIQAAEGGDLNADGIHDILDAVRTVHLILSEPPPATPFERRAADLNTDGEVDILDLAGLIRRILGAPPVAARAALPGTAFWQIRDGTILTVTTPMALQALFLLLEGPVREVKAAGGPDVWVMSRRTADGRLKALVCAIGGKGLPARQGTTQVQILPEGTAEHLRVVEIRAVDLMGREIALSEAARLPLALSLIQNYPNPFNAATLLCYTLPVESRVVLRVLSSLGQEVVRLADGLAPAGEHRVWWNGLDWRGRPVSSGVYICRLEVGNRRLATKMVLLK